MKEVYVVSVLDSLLDYSEIKVFANHSDALHEYQCAVNEAKEDNRIIEIYSWTDQHLYYEGDESSVKIIIEKTPIQ